MNEYLKKLVVLLHIKFEVYIQKPSLVGPDQPSSVSDQLKAL